MSSQRTALSFYNARTGNVPEGVRFDTESDEAAALFVERLQAEAATFNSLISTENGEWIVKGFIDIFRNIYTISGDTKVVSKLIELMLFPYFVAFAERNNYKIGVTHLPINVTHVGVPPIKCQGTKTKLVPFILRNIRWCDDGQGRWIEPFLGSGVVAFNLAPRAAILADTNRHIIELYEAIQSGEIRSGTVRAFLVAEGRKLELDGAEYYYEVRNRFNESANVLDFLFLNRSCFNGVMRFNRKGAFNVPFGHKPQRFSKAYITKIANQVDWIRMQMAGKDWEFRVAGWRDVLADARSLDFVYLDPPYIGRHTDYYNSWNNVEAQNLAAAAQRLPGGFALSMWLENRHRKNTHIDEHWAGLDFRTSRHFYHVGSTESLRNAMDEALVIKSGFLAAELSVEVKPKRAEQLALTI